MKRFALLVLLMVCLSLTAFAADVPAGDIFGGFSILHAGATSPATGTTYYGWDANGAVNVHKMVGIVGDVGGNYKSVTVGTTSVKVKVYNYLFGPRFNYRMDKWTAFGEALYGGVHATGGQSRFAMAYGGGLDVKAGKKIMVRVIEFDWVPYKNSSPATGWNKKNTRYLFGVDFPFGMIK